MKRSGAAVKLNEIMLSTAILLSLVCSSYGADKTLVWEELSALTINPLQRRRDMAIGYSKSQDSIFIYGGKGSVGMILNDFFKFNLKTKQWTKLKTPPINSRIRAVFGSRGNFMYIAAGEAIDTLTNTTTYFNDLWNYDFLNSDWKQ